MEWENAYDDLIWKMGETPRTETMINGPSFLWWAGEMAPGEAVE